MASNDQRAVVTTRTISAAATRCRSRDQALPGRALIADPQHQESDVVARLRWAQVEHGAIDVVSDVAGAEAGTRGEQRLDVRGDERLRRRVRIGEAIGVEQDAVTWMQDDGRVDELWIRLGAQDDAIRPDAHDDSIGPEQQRKRMSADREL